jgi:hypothetical protein
MTSASRALRVPDQPGPKGEPRGATATTPLPRRSACPQASRHPHTASSKLVLHTRPAALTVIEAPPTSVRSDVWRSKGGVGTAGSTHSMGLVGLSEPCSFRHNRVASQGQASGCGGRRGVLRAKIDCFVVRRHHPATRPLAQPSVKQGRHPGAGGVAHPAYLVLLPRCRRPPHVRETPSGDIAAEDPPCLEHPAGRPGRARAPVVVRSRSGERQDFAADQEAVRAKRRAHNRLGSQGRRAAAQALVAAESLLGDPVP